MCRTGAASATGNWDRCPPDFREVMFWKDGRLQPVGGIDVTRTALEGFGKSLLASVVVIDATTNSVPCRGC